MGRQSIGLLSAALVFALIGVGCGDSGEAETVATATIAKPAYVKKANSICQKTYQRTKAKYEKFTEEKGEDAFEDEEGVEEFVDTVVIPQRERMLEELRALGAVEGDEERVETILDAYQEGIDVAGEDPELAVNSTFGVFARANDLAVEYGLEECNA